MDEQSFSRRTWFSNSAVLILLMCAILFSPLSGRGMADEGTLKWDLWCTSPLIGQIAGFIGGVQVKVHVLTDWDEKGELLPFVRSSELPANAAVLVLNDEESTLLGLDVNPKLNVYLLYSRIPVPDRQINSLFSDPAALPFLAQRILTALSYFDPQHYSYFQRRLAEFQSRLESTILVGMRLLGNVKVLDISLHSRRLLQAAGCDILEPADDFWGWIDSPDSIDFYSGEFKGYREKDIVVVADFWTPFPLRTFMIENNTGVVFQKPDPHEDLFLSFHMKFLSIWNERK